ncbi:MAG TPA: NADPH:quinone oxidoreductase family protein [Acidimicrobiales bacterium]|nr:NADPH:quinone oxidoreductase family protein [Acidimicrobiales bacterium]
MDDLPEPSVGRGQVRVKIRTAAVNFPDVLIVANQYQIQLQPPFVPGSEFAGEVAEVGEGVDGVAPGERVFGTTFVGAFAEQIVVPETSVTATPPSVADDAAAAFGVAHRTAFHALRSVADLKQGEELVVLGAGGGVGLAAVQLGSVLGARVTAVASSSEKLEVARKMGAQQAVVYRARDLRDALRELLPGGADVVIDPVGGRLAEPAFRSLRRGGRFVTVGYASGDIPKIPLNLVLLKGARILGFEIRGFMTHEAEEARSNEQELMALLASGRAFPYVGATFALDDVAAALRYVADGRAIGKVVLRVA